MALLYRLTSPGGKQYIGVTNRFVQQRIAEHRYKDEAVGHALRKYGKGMTVEVLVVGEEDYLYDLEPKAIEAFGTKAPRGYNIRDGGERGHHSEETRRKISESLKGRQASSETKRRQSEAHRGWAPSAQTRQKLSRAHKGRVVSEETRRKMSESAKTRPTISEETRKKISENSTTMWAGRK